MSATLNGKLMAYEGRRNYAMLPAGPMRRRLPRSLERLAPERLAPERVRELLAGCYPTEKVVTDKRVSRSVLRAEQAAKLVKSLGNVMAAARRMRKPVKSIYNLLAQHGYSVARLTGKEAA